MKRFAVTVAIVLGLGVVAGLLVSRFGAGRHSELVAVVSMEFPGATARELDEHVAGPVGGRFAGFPHVVSVRSRASARGVSWRVTFDASVAPAAALEYVRQIEAWRAQLPAARRFSVRLTSADAPAPVSVFVTGAAEVRVLSEVAQRVADAVRLLPGVTAAWLEGEVEPELEVVLDSARLDAHGLTPLDVVDSLRNAGRDDAADRLRLVGMPPASTVDLGNAVIAQRAGAPVRLTDLASVRLAARRNGEARVGGEAAVAVHLLPAPSTTVRSLEQSVREVLADEAADWPAGVRWLTSLDAPETTVAYRIDCDGSVVEEVRAILERSPAVRRMVVRIGHSGPPAPEDAADDSASLLVHLDRSQHGALEGIRKLVSPHRAPPRIRELGGCREDRVDVVVRGERFETVDEVRARLIDRLRRTGQIDVWHESLRPHAEILVRLDRDRLARLGASVEDVARQIALARVGERLEAVSGPGAAIVVRTVEAERGADWWKDLTVHVRRDDAVAVVPIASVATVETVEEPRLIERENGRFIRTVSATQIADDRGVDVRRVVGSVVGELTLPDGVEVELR